MTNSNLTALTRKLIAAKAVEMLEEIGSYDGDFGLVARDAAFFNHGITMIDAYDLEDITDRMTSLIDYKVSEGFNLAGLDA